jgi:hypothetical protein
MEIMCTLIFPDGLFKFRFFAMHTTAELQAIFHAQYVGMYEPDFTRPALCPIGPKFGILDLDKSRVDMFVMHAEMFVMQVKMFVIHVKMFVIHAEKFVMHVEMFDGAR